MRHATFLAAVLVLLSTALIVAQEKPQRKKPNSQPGRDLTRLLDRFDKNQDGVLESKELPAQLRRRFASLDRNKDGKLTKEELQQGTIRGGGGGKPGEVNTPPARGERYTDKLRVGDKAPNFTLADPSGKTKVTLSSFKGKKPVVLIFGSYT